MAQAGNCDIFQVGSKLWTDCVQDAATGGGLMPWIVVIPLGVMVLGMFVGFARQYSAAGRRRAAAHGTSGTAGTWLIFVSFVELAIGVGSVVAARRAPGPGGGYATSAIVLLGVGIALFVAGVILKLKGRARARIYNQGLPGEATIRAVHETGVMVNNRPMYQFEADVEGAGFAPTATTFREVVPFWMAGRVGPDTKIPVKVDSSNPGRVIVDWERFQDASTAAASLASSGFAGEGGAQAPASAGVPGTGSGVPVVTPPSVADMTAALQTARAAGGSGWHLGKVFGGLALLFVVVIAGAGLYFLSSVLDVVGDTTGAVTDQVNDALEEVGGFPTGSGGVVAGPTTLDVSRRARGRGPVAYSVELPVTWLDLTAAEQERQGPLVVDVVMKPQTPSEARIVVTRSVRFLEDPAPARADVSSIRREMLAEYGDSLAGTEAVRLAGESAIAIDVAPGAGGLRSRQVAVMRGGQLLFVALTAPGAEWDAMLPAFEDVLASWRWTRA